MKKIPLLFGTLCLLAGCIQQGKKKLAEESSSKSDIIGCAPLTTDKAWYSSGVKAPKISGLEGIDFRITTNSKEAQEYFNQGMMLAYGFNHAEAARSFFEASRLDSTCAMAYWGFAYVLGPNYNGGMEPDNYERAYAATQKALSLAHLASPKEKAMIDAMAFRYTPEAPAQRGHLDSAYSQAMKKVYEQYPNDPDIGALYAESIMNLHPWNLYDKISKEQRPWTPEIVSILEKQIKLYPKHSGSHHFFIHAVETSSRPEQGLPSADLLMTLVPGAGHLVHMPSHIYINTGDYHEGTLSNIKAIKSDSTYITACHAQGAYPLAYYPHNIHYLAATATFEGNSKLAWESSMQLQEGTAKDIMVQPGWGTLQHYYSIPYFVGVKLGLWDSLLAIKPLQKDWVYPSTILHYARGMAFLGKNDPVAAEKELVAFRELAKDTSLKELSIWNINTMTDVVGVAEQVLVGAIHQHKKEYDQAIAAFQKAVALEDKLNYNEPPDWFFSVRHHLGAALLEAGKYAEAEKVYLEDLKTWKENGWALAGLHQSLQKQGKNQEASLVKSRFEKAWQYADFKL